jgi:glycosyltransferase involved in cell wall biosynthesis
MKKAAKPARTARPQLSIIVPCYNEVKLVEEALETLRATPFPWSREIIVVDDGSRDGTREILKRYADDPDFQVIFHAVNQGKGGAVRTGITHAQGKVLISHDADNEYDPAEIIDVVRPIMDGRADVVYGSRFMPGGGNAREAQRVHYFLHYLANQFLTFLTDILTNLHFTDMETAFKAVRADVLKHIPIDESRFGSEPEITSKLAQWRPRLRFYEVPISYQGRTYAEGKKIGLSDGLRAIWVLLKYNLVKRGNWNPKA